MVMIEGSTVVGVFEECARAEDAVADLERAGFRVDQIGIVEPENGGAAGGVTADDAPSGDPGVRIMGAAIGTLLGAAGAILLPGIGPVIVGGALLAPLAGAAAGATAGAVVGSLVDMGLSEQEATYYERQLELVTSGSSSSAGPSSRSTSRGATRRPRPSSCATARSASTRPGPARRATRPEAGPSSRPS